MNEADIKLLVAFFNDSWEASNLWEACHDEARFNHKSNDAIRAEMIDGDPYVGLALRLGLINEGYIAQMFTNIDALRA